MKLVGGILLVLALFGAGVYQGVLFQKVAPVARDAEAGLIFLPSPVQARIMSLGYTSIVADYYWVKALQYFTNPANDKQQYKNLPDYLEVVIGIDPQYQYAYKFAGLSIPYDTGRFRYRHTKRSTSFLERGVKLFPDWWELHFLLGYNYLNFHNEPVKAGEQFKLAAVLPSAPVYLAALSARALAVGGQIDRAIVVSEELLRGTDDQEIRDTMEKRLKDLHLEKELQRIEVAAADFKKRTGEFPAGLDALVADGLDPPPADGIKLGPNGSALAAGAERMILHSIPQQAGFGAID